MGRTRTKTRKNRPPQTEAISDEKPSAPSVPALLEKAQELIVQCEWDLARRFVERVLEAEPKHSEAKEMLGVAQLESGDLDAAKQTFQSLLPPNPDAPLPPPPAAHLYLAQLTDDDPPLALQHYRAAVDILTVQLNGKERASDSAKEDEEETRRTIVRALIGQVEIWMDPAYDLCFDPAAEKNCEDLLTAALQVDPNNTEAMQSLASVRMSQQRPDDAKTILEKAWSLWKDFEADDPRLPPISARLSLTKLFLELELYTPALLVLTGIMAADDEEVEAWYLEGWCFFMMAEKGHEGGGKLDDIPWEDLARDARDCLETCKVLFGNQGHPDAPLLEHVNELIAKLDELGIKPSPDDDGDDDEGEWEDADGSEDSDGDVKME